MMQAAISLLSVSTKMINGNPDDYLNAYKAIVLLIFSAIMQLSADTQQTSIDDAVTKMQLYFSEWISGTKSGRDMFGGNRLLTPKTAVAELKVLLFRCDHLKIHRICVNAFVLVLFQSNLCRFGCHYLLLSVLLNLPTIGMGLSKTLLNHVSTRSVHSCAPGLGII